MKKVFFVLIAIIVLTLTYLNWPKETVKNDFEPVNYIEVTAVGNVSRPGTYKVPSNITKDELLELFGLKTTSVYVDFTIQDGLIINFLDVVENPVVIQNASYEALDSLPGIGEARAQKIIEYIKVSGGFNNWEDFFNLVGIKNSEDQLAIKQQAILR